MQNRTICQPFAEPYATVQLARGSTHSVGLQDGLAVAERAAGPAVLVPATDSTQVLSQKQTSATLCPVKQTYSNNNKKQKKRKKRRLQSIWKYWTDPASRMFCCITTTLLLLLSFTSAICSLLSCHFAICTSQTNLNSLH